MDETGQISLSAELIRKGIHLFALVIPLGYFFIAFPVAISGVLLAAIVSIVIDLSRFRNWPLWSWLARIMGTIFREHEMKGGFSGATYILSTAALTMIIFPKAIAVAALIFIIIGDTVAALIGRPFGKHRLLGNKSIEGSSACLISLLLVAWALPDLPVPAGIAGAVVATVAELLSGKVDDNLTVPLSSGAAMLIVMRLMGAEQAILFAPLIHR